MGLKKIGAKILIGGAIVSAIATGTPKAVVQPVPDPCPERTLLDRITAEAQIEWAEILEYSMDADGSHHYWIAGPDCESYRYSIDVVGGHAIIKAYTEDEYKKGIGR